MKGEITKRICLSKRPSRKPEIQTRRNLQATANGAETMEKFLKRRKGIHSYQLKAVNPHQQQCFKNFFKIEIANTVRQKLEQVVFIKHFKLAVWYEKGITARFRATANLGLNKRKITNS